MAPITRSRTRARACIDVGTAANAETKTECVSAKAKGRSIDEWSSPIRRSGHLILPEIPAEIYLEIIGYLWPDDAPSSGRTKDMYNLALACRFLASVVLPMIYREVVFRPPDMSAPIADTEKGEEDSEEDESEEQEGKILSRRRNFSSNRTFLPFCHSLIAGESSAQILATYVRTCVLRDYDMYYPYFDLDSDSDSDSEVPSMSFKTHVSALSNLLSLTTLTLYRVPLNPTMLNTIGTRLVVLDDFSVDCCDFADVAGNDVRVLASRLETRLKKFRFTCRDSSRGYKLVKPDFTKIKEFESLCAAPSAEEAAAAPRAGLQALSTDSWIFMRVVMAANGFLASPSSLASTSGTTTLTPLSLPLPLRSLSVHFVMNYPQLCTFIYSLTSTLEELSLDVVSCPEPSQYLQPQMLGGLAQVQEPYTLDLGRLPNLKKLRCPPHLAYHLRVTPSVITAITPYTQNNNNNTTSSLPHLTHLSFQTRQSLSSPDERAFLTQSISSSSQTAQSQSLPAWEGWGNVRTYATLVELLLPYTYAIEIKPGTGARENIRAGMGQGSRGRGMGGGEVGMNLVSLKKLTVIGDGNGVLGRGEFQEVLINALIQTWRAPKLECLCFWDLIVEDFEYPFSASASVLSSRNSASEGTGTITTHTTGIDTTTPFPFTQTILSLLTLSPQPQPQPTTSDTPPHEEFGLASSHGDLAFPGLEWVEFVGTVRGPWVMLAAAAAAAAEAEAQANEGQGQGEEYGGAADMGESPSGSGSLRRGVRGRRGRGVGAGRARGRVRGGRRAATRTGRGGGGSLRGGAIRGRERRDNMGVLDPRNEDSDQANENENAWKWRWAWRRMPSQSQQLWKTVDEDECY